MTSNRNQLNHISQQPQWLSVNVYLLRGHRPPSNSYIYCLKSIFKLHNETLNIWTHLIPCVLFIFILCRLMISEEYNYTDKIFVGAYNLAALLCHALSATYHIFVCHSRDVGRFFQKLDFTGIIGLITLSIVSWIHAIYGNLSPIYSRAYIIIFIFFATILIYLLTNNKFCFGSHTIMRVIILTSFGTSAIVPLIHWFINYWHLKYEYLNLSVILFISQGIYLLGAFMYANKVPERYYPGKFDIFFNSHQFFHVCCTIAALCHNYAVLQLVRHFKNVNKGSIIMTPNVMMTPIE